MRSLYVNALLAVCAALDAAPTWERVDGRVRHFRGGWGCRWGLSRHAAELDERWGSDVFRPV